MRNHIWLIFLLFFVKANCFFEETPKNSILEAHCPQIYPRECESIRIYVFDFSFDYLTSDDFYDVKLFLKESIKDWFEEKVGMKVKIGRIDGLNIVNQSNSNNGFLECGNLNQCFNIINTLKYENAVEGDWNNNELVFTNAELSLQYSNNLTSILKESFILCPYNSAILLTNRIVDMKQNGSKNITDICVKNCIELSVILFGRNETNPTEDLEKYYDYIPESSSFKNTTFNVPDYNCVENLIPCFHPFLVRECSNLTLNECSPISTPTLITTTEMPNTFHITYILGFSVHVSQFSFYLVLSSLIGPLQDVADIRPIKVNVITSANNISKNIQSMQDFRKLIQNFNSVSSQFKEGKEFMDRIKLGIETTQFEVGDEKRIILLTDYFPVNMSHSTNNFESLRNNNLQIYVYNQNSYKLYQQNNINSNFIFSYLTQIPLLPSSTPSTFKHKTPTTSTTQKAINDVTGKHIDKLF